MGYYAILLQGNQGQTYRLEYREGEGSRVISQIKELINNPLRGLTKGRVIQHLMESAGMKSDSVARKIGDLCNMILEEV